MAKVYEFLANGFEEVEGLAPVDILRRGGVDIKTVSVTGSEYVETSHGITIKADLTIENANLSDADMLLLPGGLPGATNLRDHEGVCAALKAQAAKGGRIGAICAAPLVLGHLGLLEGRYATCYPGQRHQSDTKLAGWFRQLLQVHPCFLVITDHRYCSCIRCAGRCIDMGCRSVQRYICRR